MIPAVLLSIYNASIVYIYNINRDLQIKSDIDLTQEYKEEQVNAVISRLPKK